MKRKTCLWSIGLTVLAAISCDKQEAQLIPAGDLEITMSIDEFKTDDGSMIPVPGFNAGIAPAGLFAVMDGKIVETCSNIVTDITAEGNRLVLDIRNIQDGGLPLEADWYLYWPYSDNPDFTPDPSATDAEGFFKDLAGKWTTPENQSDYEDFMRSLLIYGNARITDGKLSFAMQHGTGLLRFELPGIRYEFTNENFEIADYEIVFKGEFENLIPYRTDDGTYLLSLNPENVAGLSGNYGEYGWDMEGTLAKGECGRIRIGDGMSTVQHLLQNGDFFCSDGTLVSKDAPQEQVTSSDVVGMVFQTDPARIGNGEKEALGGKAHALVVACKIAADGKLNAWFAKDGESSRDETGIGMENIFVADDAYATYRLADADIEGYRNNMLIRTQRKEDYDNGVYPAFKTAEDFGKEAGRLSTDATTGWYLPSNGQWFDIIRNLTGATLDDSNLTDWGAGDFYWIGTGALQQALDAAMEKVSPHLKSSFYIYSYQWTSSAASETGARYFDFYDGEAYCNNLSKSHEDPVRCVLAF